MTAMTSPRPQNKLTQPLVLVVTGLLTVVGIVAWVLQLRGGMGTTSLSNLNTWGAYIAGFIFFMGLSAGSLVLAALPVIFELPRFRPYSKLAVFVALVSLVVAGLFILVDIGRPERLWRIVRFGQLGSPMLWDLLLTIGYFIIATVFLRRLMTAKSDASLKVVAWVALLAGIADGITAFVFATQIGREFWFSAVQPIAFFTAALASAGAMLLLLMVVLKAAGYSVPECCDLNPLTGLTAASLALGLMLLASEVVTLSFTRSATAMKLVNGMLVSPLFWIEVATGLLAILLLILPATRKSAGWVAFASLVALFHLVVKRLVFVRMGFTVPNIDYAGVALAPTSGYMPNLVEWGVMLGLTGLFLFLLTLGFRALRLAPQAE